jgi:copper chaperone CopZ
MQKMANEERLRFKVIDFSCSTCLNAFRKKLRSVEGVTDVLSNAVTNEIYVYFDPEIVEPERIESTIKGIGYKTIREYD